MEREGGGGEGGRRAGDDDSKGGTEDVDPGEGLLGGGGI